MKLPSIDLDSIRNDFQNLDPKDVGTWPLIPRIVVLFAIFVFVLVGGWFLALDGQRQALEMSRAEETKLKEQYVSNKKSAVNLELYTQQLAEMNRTFSVLVKQLPGKAEIESLLIEINQSGMGRGLQFELFKPNQEVVRDFYAELPIVLRVTGTYHDFGAFAEDIGKLSRIVTLNNITITSAKDGSLAMDAVTKTFRYLDDKEVAARKQTRGGRR
ncbi:MAG: type 4a pilus biogenesis protein PilO [Candidatus Accumulibacter sp.]|jgi:type IV pilus assembly protein PilO|nr:type 4a pilus biogenesis protein PilO [Accumulibacter sp.]